MCLACRFPRHHRRCRCSPATRRILQAIRFLLWLHRRIRHQACPYRTSWWLRCCCWLILLRWCRWYPAHCRIRCSPNWRFLRQGPIQRTRFGRSRSRRCCLLCPINCDPKLNFFTHHKIFPLLSKSSKNSSTLPQILLLTIFCYESSTDSVFFFYLFLSFSTVFFLSLSLSLLQEQQKKTVKAENWNIWKSFFSSFNLFQFSTWNSSAWKVFSK